MTETYLRNILQALERPQRLQSPQPVCECVHIAREPKEGFSGLEENEDVRVQEMIVQSRSCLSNKVSPWPPPNLSVCPPSLSSTACHSNLKPIS